MRKRKEKTARAIKPNPGIRVWYRRHLDRLIERLKRSVLWWIPAAYRKEAEAGAINQAMEELRRYWTSVFDREAEPLADGFVKQVDSTCRNAIRRSLAEVGFNVDWSRDRTVQKVLSSIRQTQVDLIKSIPQQSLDRVAMIVQNGVQAGRDIAAVKESLSEGLGITARRARMIAIDQTQKATHAINRARYTAVGIREAVWVHVAGRYTSRPTHVRMHGQRFRLDGPEAGMFDPAVGYRVMCGELINCRCSCRPVIPDNFFDI